MSHNVASHNDVINDVGVTEPRVKYDVRLANLKSYPVGQSGNPNGRPTGSRNRLSERFLSDLHDIWAVEGAAALSELRSKDVGRFCQIVAMMIPKQSAHIRANVSTTRTVTDVDQALIASLTASGYTVTAPTGTESVPVLTGGASKGSGEFTAVDGGCQIKAEDVKDNIPVEPATHTYPDPVVISESATLSESPARLNRKSDAGGQPCLPPITMADRMDLTKDIRR